MASSHEQTSALLDAIATAGNAWAQEKPGARAELLTLAHALTAKLETPSEVLQRIGWAEPARFAAMRLAVDLKLFDTLSESEGAAKSAGQLARVMGAETPLVARIMKHLTAMNVVAETGADAYEANLLSIALTSPKYRDGIIYLHDVAGPSFRKLPDYLRQTGYKNPHDISDGPFQYAHQTELPFFAWFEQHPALLQRFNSYMGGYRHGKYRWIDSGFYPVQERFTEHKIKADKDAVLLVDVGGGLGHDLEDFKSKYTHLPGRLVLQERPEVIAQITQENPGFESMSHDFFTAQPIQGAKAYYLHSVLHDWDDEKSVQILKQLVPALQKGYSKILINENMVPDAGASWSITAMDFLMMALGAVRERTEKQWRELLSLAGLKVVNIWTYEQGTESLIEAELHDH